MCVVLRGARCPTWEEIVALRGSYAARMGYWREILTPTPAPRRVGTPYLPTYAGMLEIIYFTFFKNNIYYCNRKGVGYGSKKKARG